ncbi:response regulator [Dyadobacter sp. NIV53]|uniref:response regulator n=1 Tax=Dyadobacter sp. NIV53 TaxID=2861765 RepID=UPI001E2FBB0B|nr:response regulator [Dyadobacter sp. NIV53]
MDIFSESFILQTRTILLADDDEDDIFLFRESIKDFQINIHLQIAKNGFEVIRYLDKMEPDDLVFLDINMPGMNGFECLAEIRARTKSVAVIMLSTSNDTGYIELSEELGATGYVVKPSSLPSYITAVKEVLLTDWQNYQLGFYLNNNQNPAV